MDDLQSVFTSSLPLWMGLSAFGAASLLIFFSLPRKKWAGTFVAITVMATAAMLLMKTIYYPAIASKRTLKPFATRLRENIDPQTPLLFYNSLDYGTVFYSRRHIADYAEQIGRLRPPVFLLMWEEDLERLRRRHHLETLDISEGRGPVAEHRLILVKSSELLPRNLENPENHWPKLFTPHASKFEYWSWDRGALLQRNISAFYKRSE